MAEKIHLVTHFRSLFWHPIRISLIAHASTSGATGGTTPARDTSGATVLIGACAYGSHGQRAAVGESPTIADSYHNVWERLDTRDNASCKSGFAAPRR